MSMFRRGGTFGEYIKDHPVTFSLIVLNTLFLFRSILTGGFSPENSIKQGGITKDLFLDGQYYRIITAAFLHGSLMHYFSNMIIGLNFLGSGLERMLGKAKYLIIYFVAIVGSGLLVVYSEVLFPASAGVTIVSVGASGGIFGLLGALFYITIFRKDMLSIQDIQTVRILIVLNIIFTFLNPGISISGHVGGFISGFVISFLLIRRDVFKILH